ncbi:MAG: YeeE/YedE thiosulfate transporter family protein [Saprospiraceae bacterium]
MELLSNPWPWYIAGPLIGLILASLIFFGRTFGFSRNLDTICSIVGAGKITDHFKFDLKSRMWGLVFAVGAIIGGYIASNYMTPDKTVAISEATKSNLESYNFETPGSSFLPSKIFGEGILQSPKAIFFLLVGGFFVGFGTRYAGGCTSGHAITGLSNLQLPSLVAVIGFFIGGLVFVHLLFPIIFK